VSEELAQELPGPLADVLEEADVELLRREAARPVVQHPAVEAPAHGALRLEKGEELRLRHLAHRSPAPHHQVHDRLGPGALDGIPDQQDQTDARHDRANEADPLAGEDSIRGRDLAFDPAARVLEAARVLAERPLELVVEVVKLLLLGKEDLRMPPQVLPEPGGSGLLGSDAEEVGQREPTRGPGPARIPALLDAPVARLQGLGYEPRHQHRRASPRG
jgi:hypothetical protein